MIPLLEIVCIVVGAGLMVLVVYMGKTEEKPELPAAPEPPLDKMSLENASKLQTSLTQLLHELTTLSRDITMDLEQKLSDLKEVLQLADTKLEELTQASAGRSGVYRADPEPEIVQENRPKPPEPELEVTIEDEPLSPPVSDRYQEIYEMADNRFSVDEIARRMQMGKGEIQLILSLRKKA